ncbi:DUF3703 domain-containing protein [Hahella sp. KA22]|uniref:DUF3703 domain-containing protein n=1 Tax=Hahella sp. KA22 TaxID=1628392 RepID=UPI000FDD1ECD|nr:DUF3703 domain-containing protein [Hahella sp. KA22]AZZ92563.1 DUF3703 domain-containing protein [Hahella sp. KA22]QAY55936.1 DUF3703 domain-containing protein [Hahella sp. KA22]
MTTLQQAFSAEMNAAQDNWRQGLLDVAFAHLENAHVLGQRRLGRHFHVHLWMLRVGWAKRDQREIRGQLWRLLLTPLGHLTGRLPIGNTGGANVSAFTPMPVRKELEEVLREHSSLDR